MEAIENESHVIGRAVTIFAELPEDVLGHFNSAICAQDMFQLLNPDPEVCANHAERILFG